MLSHDINPIIFRIGFMQVTWYAFVYLIGFIVALFILLKASKKKEINITENEVYDFVFLGIIFMMLGARLFHVLFWGVDYYFQNPIKIFHVWEGGLSFHGGLFALLVFTAIYTKVKKINFWKLADILALLGVIMPAFSRVANFVNQEIVGTITNVPWCFEFKYHKGCRHPVQLYASAGRLALFACLVYIKRKLKEFKEGFIFWLFIFGIGLGRFILDFWRQDEIFHGLKAGQWLSLIMVFISLFALAEKHWKDVKKLFKK